MFRPKAFRREVGSGWLTLTFETSNSGFFFISGSEKANIFGCFRLHFIHYQVTIIFVRAQSAFIITRNRRCYQIINNS